MSRLARQQQALLQALFGRPDVAPPGCFSGARGLQAYRDNAAAHAERSLLAAYPVLSQLLGRESFDLLARELWQAHPPLRGDLASWGDELPAFLHAIPQLADEPYLADVARVEWALHRAATAADGTADPATFALLGGAAPQALTLTLAAGTAVITSAYPVASIVLAHREDDPSRREAALQEAGRRLRAGMAENALVWRQGLRPRIDACSASDAAFVRALLSGAALAQALDQAGDRFAFDRWLPQMVQQGLVLGAARA